MAVVKLGTTKSANRLINYCEKRSEERESVNCDIEHVKGQFKLERAVWGKEDGVQAHHVIMSFPPYVNNMSTRDVAEAGKRLAEELAPGHSAAVYVHADKEHLHAHIVINSVNLETGKKLHLTPSDYFKTQEISDRICQERGWHVIQEKRNHERYTLAERELVAKGQTSWKDELRSWIREGHNHTQNLQELKTYLHRAYGVEMKIQDKNVSFLHPDAQKYVRGKTLGDDFTKEGLNNGYELGRTQQTARTARQPARTNERIIQSAERFNQADRSTNRGITKPKERDTDRNEQSSNTWKRTNEALRESRQRLEEITSRFIAGSTTTEQKHGDDTKQLDSTNIQQERENYHVSTSRVERSDSFNGSTSAIKAVLDVVHQEINRMESEKESVEMRKKQFRAVNYDRGEERERER